jgi:hypothetical protein
MKLWEQLERIIEGDARRQAEAARLSAEAVEGAIGAAMASEQQSDWDAYAAYLRKQGYSDGRDVS